jgi:hypothetical protein
MFKPLPKFNWRDLERVDSELTAKTIGPAFWATEVTAVEADWKAWRASDRPLAVPADGHPHGLAIAELMLPFTRRLDRGLISGVHNVSTLMEAFRDYLREPASIVLTGKLRSEMQRDKLYVAGIEVNNAPIAFLLEYNHMEETDPRVGLYRTHPVWGPDIVDFGIFLDRFDAMKDVVCLFVWSHNDRSAVSLPCITLNPYPLCWSCEKQFGLLKCKNCLVARYCGRECQVKEWAVHKSYCVRLQEPQRKHQTLSF